MVNYSNDLASVKMFILYVVAKAPGATYHLLMNKLIERNFVDFLLFSQSIEELSKVNMLLVRNESDGTGNKLESSEEKTYEISASGKAVLGDLLGSINQLTSGELDEISSEINAELAKRARATSKMRMNEKMLFEVELEAKDEDSNLVMKTTLIVKSEAEAKRICEEFKRDGVRKYEKVFEILTNKT